MAESHLFKAIRAYQVARRDYAVLENENPNNYVGLADAQKILIEAADDLLDAAHEVVLTPEVL